MLFVCFVASIPNNNDAFKNWLLGRAVPEIGDPPVPDPSYQWPVLVHKLSSPPHRTAPAPGPRPPAPGPWPLPLGPLEHDRVCVRSVSRACVICP